MKKLEVSGADGIRTHDLLDAIEARSQLRHGPTGVTDLKDSTSGEWLRPSLAHDLAKYRQKCLYLRGYARRRRAEVREKGVVCTGERAAAEHDGTDGADRLVIGDADIATLRFFVDGHFGNDRNTHARADHAEKAAELAAFENDLRMETGAVAGGNGGIAEAVAIAQEQEGFGAEIFEGERLARGEFVFLGEHGEETLGQ